MPNRVKSFFVVCAVPALALVAPFAMGCGGSAATDSQAQATSAAGLTKAPVAQSAHGPVKLVGLALGEVSPSDTQRASLEKLAADADARQRDDAGGAAGARRGGRRAGRGRELDRDGAPAEDRRGHRGLVSRRAPAEPLRRSSSSTPSSTAGQRAAFVDALKAKMHDAKDQHVHKGGMKQWATDLALTDAQKATLKDAMRAKFAAMHQAGGGAPSDFAHHGKEVLAAFTADRFVMDEVAPKVDAQAAVTRMTSHMLGLVETALPVLTAEQRAIAAQKIRAHTDGAHGFGF